MPKTGVEKGKRVIVKRENAGGQPTESDDVHKPGPSGEDQKGSVTNSQNNSTSSLQKEQVPSETNENEKETSEQRSEEGGQPTSSENTSESEQSEEEPAGEWQVRTMAQAKKWTLDLEADDLPAQLKLFKYRHSKMLKVSKITDPEAQAASFIQELPDEATTIIMEYGWTESGKSENNIDDIIEVLVNAKKKKSSRIVARHRLLTRFMRKGERFSDFKKALYTLADQCGYTKEQKEDMVRDIIISRHNEEAWQKQLLYDLTDEATLDQVVTLCEKHEDTKDAAKEIHRNSNTSHQVNANHDRKEKKERKNEKERKDKNGLWRCDKFCGGYHIRGRDNCKAYGTTCAKCGRQNHFEEVCKEKNPLPGWKPKNEASKENHKRVLEKSYAARDDSESETRNSDNEQRRGRGYDTDTDQVKSDSEESSSSEDTRRPARRVDVVREKLVITARQDSDLRNHLERRARNKRKRKKSCEQISRVLETNENDLCRRSGSQDRRHEARRSPRIPRKTDVKRQDDRQRKRSSETVRDEGRRESKRRHTDRPNHRGNRSPSKEKKKLPDKEEHSRITRETKKVPEDELDFELPNSDEDSDLVSEKRKAPRLWDENVAINGRVHRMKVDSGSTINTISWKNFQKLRLSETLLEPTETTIRTYSMTQMKPLGQFRATLSLRGRRTQALFLVLEEDVPSLLGLPSGAALGLFCISHRSVVQYIWQEDEEVFEGITNEVDEFLQPCQKTVTLKMKDDAEPVIIPARRVPLALRDDVYEELQRMEKIGVISPVHEPRPWCHAMVVARKPNGKLRICIDPRTLNPHLEREEMLMPDVDSIITDLENAKVLSVIDLEAGFWQVGVDSESAKLLTFATPWGRYQYNRLPFGISVAPEIFHKAVVDALQGIPGVEVFVDDILVHGPDGMTHNKRLDLVRARLKEKNFTENTGKSGQIGQSEVRFLGHIVGNGKIRPDPKKIEALLNFPEPTCRKELRGFEGMLGWLRKFLPELTTYMNDFRHLQKAHTAWIWTAKETETFNKIKETLKKIEPLMAIKRGEQLLVAADASAFGLGATLTQ